VTGSAMAVGPSGAAPYGLLTYPGSANLGDEIQSLAARRFLPRVDRLVSREALHLDPGGAGPTRLILNGWFLNRPLNWPPHPKIEPLIVSFHMTLSAPSRLRRWAATVQGTLLSAEGVAYLNRWAPVGARDRRTLDLLRSAGVDAYLSGCLTLTLPAPRERRAEGPVVACDLPNDAINELSARLGFAAMPVSHSSAEIDPERRLGEAQRLLDVYATARAVVTTRLHAALPCLAMGTPVLFLAGDQEQSRIAPALDLCRSATLAQFAAGSDGFDPRDPPPNRDRHIAMAADLKRRCRAFVERG
jgi:hypothetical protein